METVPTHIHKAIERFNPAQKEAVVNTDGPMLIIAGAGSGKTSVLTTRIALLMAQGVMPERVLALTFTKKAAEEMRSRIISLQGNDARRICMGTFHSVFIGFLRPFAERLGFPSNFTVLDEDDSLATLKKCITAVIAPNRPPRSEWNEADKKRYDEEDKNYKPKTIRNIISHCKNELITADDYYQDQHQFLRDVNAGRPKTRDIFRLYRDTCLRMAMMDFDDILLHTYRLLEGNPDVMAMIAGSFDYILVDEYQDTNFAQYSILKKLTWLNKNICVVGDDSQSIYAFRGARIENIMNYQNDYPGCRVVKLEQNYRSTKNIVNAANNLISKNENRIPKVCFSDSDKGDPIILKTCRTEKDEAQYIASSILSKKRSEGRPFTDFAVLYRTNAQSRAIEDALVKARVPYVIYSGVSFFARQEIKDMMAYFKLAVNPHDNESFLRVVNKPLRSFGDAAQKRLQEIAMAWGVSLYDAASNPQIELCGFSAKAMKGLQNFLQNIQEAAKAAAEDTASAAADWISDATGFIESYDKEKDEESKNRAENLRELLASVRSYEEDLQERNESLDEQSREPSTLSGYLQNIMLMSNADTGNKEGDNVSLMTVHCAKGLEFDTVFIAGMDKTLFPLEIEGDTFELEEERRLFYVAVTRAKRCLTLTRADSRMKYGQRKNMSPSSFIGELKKKMPT